MLCKWLLYYFVSKTIGKEKSLWLSLCFQNIFNLQLVESIGMELTNSEDHLDLNKMISKKSINLLSPKHANDNILYVFQKST
jgi:hypothetical protein